MKFQKGDKVIVVDAIGIPSSLIGQRMRVVAVLSDGVTCWCQPKQGGRFYLNASVLETIKIHRRKERIKRKIEVLQAKIQVL